MNSNLANRQQGFQFGDSAGLQLSRVWTRRNPAAERIRVSRHTPRTGSFNQKHGFPTRKEIGTLLCREKRNLTGPEVYFLRHEIQTSQAVLAQLIEVKELTIHRWEAGKIMEALKRIAYLEDGIDRQQELVFRLSGGDSHSCNQIDSFLSIAKLIPCEVYVYSVAYHKRRVS